MRKVTKELTVLVNKAESNEAADIVLILQYARTLKRLRRTDTRPQ